MLCIVWNHLTDFGPSEEIGKGSDFKGGLSRGAEQDAVQP